MINWSNGWLFKAEIEFGRDALQHDHMLDTYEDRGRDPEDQNARDGRAESYTRRMVWHF